MTDQLAVNILIPTHNRPDFLRKTLDSLSTAELPPEVTGIYVIENGSSVAEAVVRSHALGSLLRYRHVIDGNKSAALNQCASELSPDSLLLFIDDDIRVAPDAITTMVDGAKRYGRNAYYGISLRAEYESVPDPRLLPYLPYSATDYSLSPDGGDVILGEEFRVFLGACWACYHDELTRVGGFSASYGPGSASGSRGQEGDAQQRLFKAGVRAVFLGRSFVWHWVPDRVMTAEWVLDRVFQSAKQIGEKRSRLKTSLLNAAMLLLAIGRRWVGINRLSDAVRAKRAAGYFWGLANTWIKRTPQ